MQQGRLAPALGRFLCSARLPAVVIAVLATVVTDVALFVADLRLVPPDVCAVALDGAPVVPVLVASGLAVVLSDIASLVADLTSIAVYVSPILRERCRGSCDAEYHYQSRLFDCVCH